MFINKVKDIDHHFLSAQVASRVIMPADVFLYFIFLDILKVTLEALLYGVHSLADILFMADIALYTVDRVTGLACSVHLTFITVIRSGANDAASFIE